MRVDLHAHSTASDGAHTPAEVMAMAVAAGLELLALTDHDTIAGVRALLAAGSEAGPCTLVPGIEISCRWRGRTVHVLGLAVDPLAGVMAQAQSAQHAVRLDRARRIDAQLRRQGIAGAFEGAVEVAGDAPPCRPHFARWLVRSGHCRDARAAFDRYLDNRRLKGVDVDWPDLAVAVDWIRAANGLAVLAHPEDYRLTRSKLVELSLDFRAAGGSGLELAAPGRPEAAVRLVEGVVREHRLAASVGSDFHGGPGAWRSVGRTRPMPADLQPIWDLF